MTNFIKEKEIELLKEIREYTFDNKELLNAHHFLFACPVKKNGKPADVIVCGINPGGDPKEADYRKVYQGKPFPTEESSDYDWWVDDNNKKRSDDGAYSKFIHKILGEEKNITLTEVFFWNSTTTKKEDFDNRYGYSLKKNPHWDFCVKMNLELFKAHNPDLILFLKTQKGFPQFIAEKFNLNEINSLELPKGNRKGATRMYHYETEDSAPFIFIPHPSGYNPSLEEIEVMRQYLDKVNLI
jgi:hypothetical protein